MYSNCKRILGHNTNDFGFKKIVENKIFQSYVKFHDFGGHFENMQIRSLRRHFSACQHCFLDSAYQITPSQGVKTFSSQNACTC